VTDWARQARGADVIILTALSLELDAVLQVDAGAVPGSVWEEVEAPSGLPVLFRSFVGPTRIPRRIFPISLAA
jgi:hypothetical protein